MIHKKSFIEIFFQLLCKIMLFKIHKHSKSRLKKKNDDNDHQKHRIWLEMINSRANLEIISSIIFNFFNIKYREFLTKYYFHIHIPNNNELPKLVSVSVP